MIRSILAIGDIIGPPGMRAVYTLLPGLKKAHKADLTIVNGENAADGYGLTPELAEIIFAAGADVITTGNHIWQQKEINRYLDEQPGILRPANYPSKNPGHGHCIVERHGFRYAVINLQGRQRMWPIDCPFQKVSALLRKIKNDADAFIVDFHADDPQEKEALAYYLDGRVSAVYGTHTHIQTADHRILPKGLGYTSDIGATGPGNSIIGFNAEIGIQRNLTDLPLRNEVSSNPAVLNGFLMRIDENTPLRCSFVEPFSAESGV